MKILMITSSDLSINHGPVVHYVEVASALHQLGVDLTSFSPTSQKKSKTNIFSSVFSKRLISFLPRNFSFQIELIFHLIFRILKKKPYCFYIRQSSYMIVPQIIAKIFRIRSIVEINGVAKSHSKVINRGYLKSIVIELVEKVSLRISDQIIVVTKGLKDYIINEYNINGKKISVVSNGVNHEKFKKIELAKSIKEKLLGEGNLKKIILVYLGSIEKWQGLDLLINVAKKLSRVRNDFIILVIGSGSIEKQIKDMIEEDGLSKYFHFVGEKNENEVINYLSCSQIGLLPIYNEEKLSHDLSPMKLYTYLAMSLPVIGPDIPGIQILKTFNCGEVVTPGDDSAYVYAINYMINKREESIMMGKNGRYLVEKELNWNKVAEQTLEIIRNYKQ